MYLLETSRHRIILIIRNPFVLINSYPESFKFRFCRTISDMYFSTIYFVIWSYFG